MSKGAEELVESLTRLVRSLGRVAAEEAPHLRRAAGKIVSDDLPALQRAAERTARRVIEDLRQRRR